MSKNRLLITILLIVTTFSFIVSIMPNISSSDPEKIFIPQNGTWLGENYNHELNPLPLSISVGSVAMSDEKYSAFVDKTENAVIVYDNHDNKTKRTFNPILDDTINSVSMSENGEFIAFGSDSGWVRLYNRFRLLPLIDSHLPGDSKVYSLSLQRDDFSRYLAVGTGDAIYCFDRFGLVDYRWSYTTHCRVNSVSVSNSSPLFAWVAAGDNYGDIYVFHANNNGPINSPDWKYSSGACITKVVISDDGSNVVAGNGFGEILYFNRADELEQTNPPLWTYNASSYITSIAVSSNGDWFAVGTMDSKLYLFNSNYPMPLWTYTFNGPITSLAMSQDGSYISVATNGDNKVFLFSRLNKVPLWSYSVDENACIAMSGNGEEIVVGTNEHYYYIKDEYDLASDITWDSDDGDENTIPFVLKILHDPNGDLSYSTYHKYVICKAGLSLDLNAGNNVQYEVDTSLFGNIEGSSIEETSTEGSVSAEVQLSYKVSEDFASSLVGDDPEYIGPKYGDGYLVALCNLNYSFNERDITFHDGTIVALPIIKFGLYCDDNIILTTESHLDQYFRQDQIDFLHSVNLGYDNKIDTWGEKNLVKKIQHYDIGGGTYVNYETEWGVYFSLSATLKISLIDKVIEQWDLTGENFGVTGRKLVSNSATIGATAKVYIEQGKSYLLHAQDGEGDDSIGFTLYEDKIFQTLLPITDSDSETSNPEEHWTNGEQGDPPSNSPPYQPELGVEPHENPFPWEATADTSDPDGDNNLEYLFDWCDGYLSDWGDDSSSHSFDTYGNYLIKAKARDPGHHESIWSEPGNISIPNVYSFQVTTQQLTQPISHPIYTIAVGEPLSYQFYEIQNPEQSIEEWELTFGDGFSQRSMEQQGTYSYDDPGFFYLNHSIYNGTYYNFSKNITVIPVRADINASTIWSEPNESILFHNASWSNVSIINCSWNFGDNTTGYGTQVSHLYEEQGDFVVSLTVTNANGANDTCFQVIHVDTEPEIVEINSSQEIVQIGEEVDIHVDVYDLLINETDNCPISLVYTNISFPDNSYGIYPMEYIGNESDIYSYELKFFDTKMVGTYNYIVSVLDDAYNSNTSLGHSFNVSYCFGYTNIGSYSQSVEDRIVGSVFTANSYGIADNITRVHPDFEGMELPPGYPRLKCMIFRANDSQLIGTTEEKIGLASTFNFSDPKPELIKNTEYILMFWGNNSNAKIYYDDIEDESGRYLNLTYNSSIWPDPLVFTNESRTYSIYCSYTPTAPEKPTLWGPLTITENVAYTYSASTNSSDENASLYYQFDWGDDSELSDWIGPFASGATCNNATHTWTEQGYYDIKVRAKDESGAISCWSDPLPIVAPFDDDPEPQVGISPSIHNIEDFQLEEISIGELNIGEDVIKSVTDVIDSASEVYHYGAKIKNIGSTDIEGYLRTIVRYFDQISEQWITLNDPVNETTSRTINSGKHLALGPIFKGRVHTKALTNGNGNYRVYAVFGDSDGNVLKCNDDTYLVVKCEFTVTGL